MSIAGRYKVYKVVGVVKMKQLVKEHKALLVANTARFFVLFEKNNIKLLQSMGYVVHCASNFGEERNVDAENILKKMGVTIHQIDIARSPFSMSNWKAYQQLKALMRQERFALVHCHTPVGGVLARLAAATTQTAPVLYTAHGFHFYKGCPLHNRLIYETVERWMARYTDGLITINEEDYQAAKTFKLRGEVYKIPGVGVKIDEIRDMNVNRELKRKELDIPQNSFVFISVGELIKRKNHEEEIRAFHELKNDNCMLLIAGSGVQKEYLENIIRELGEKRVKLLGFRSDVSAILHCADAFVFASRQEGLGLVGIEAMAAGLPLITTDIRGICEYSKDNITGFTYQSGDIKGLTSAMEKIIKTDSATRERFSEHNKLDCDRFDYRRSNEAMRKIYTEFL